MMRIFALLVSFPLAVTLTSAEELVWTALPDLPSELGVAGPYVGIHDGNLLVAGGANFPKPVWENDKVWHDTVYALPLEEGNPRWSAVGVLPRPLGYGTTVSVPEGLICIGGNDVEKVYADVFLLSVSDGKVETAKLPSLPTALCYASSAMLGDSIYVAGGQTGPGLETATTTFLRLDWSKRGRPEEFAWEKMPSWPGRAIAFGSLVSDSESIYLLGGRNLDASDEVEFLAGMYRFRPDSGWQRKANLPRPVAAGTASWLGNGKIVVPAGADGSLFARSDELKDDHPGFPKTVLWYDPEADSWSEGGEVPLNQVTTEAKAWKEGFLIASGEVRPRVRTPKVWMVSPKK